ncbi:hypothetical protein [Methylocucumis oryzae]|uniref:PAC domain-containing protein n=1 Tax=Methylocucumis oryzae TaxID=1632867 RepID=A0A0F3IJ43_9GAMM|nr:hypothetical protein [Methylocucumis oryzae]KJV06682.1 hypothetical protein VZ94_09785 [Methylocucumis oryzae]
MLWESKDFLDILFRDHVNLKLIESLNPLRQVELFFKDSGIKKHLAFQFSRVDDKHRAVSHVLVTVKDLTQQVALALQLEKSEQKVEEQMTFFIRPITFRPRVS